MQTEELLEAFAYHSAEEILANPLFEGARRIYVDAALRLYENEPSLTRLMLEAGRILTFRVIVCLHARHEGADRETWPTVGRLKATLDQFQAASPRQVDEIVRRLTHTGYLQIVPAPGDRRVRIVIPTDKMYAHDREWLAAHFAPLDHMFPIPGYALAMKRDPLFHKAELQASIAAFARAAQTMSENPPMMFFLTRHAGMLILMKLIQTMQETEDEKGLSYADIGLRFGVSRTHVRMLLRDAERLGLVRCTNTQLVQLMPAVLKAFDRLLADGMASHDLIYQMALAQLDSALSAA